jgi:glycosyltransferase involved in cell wall biosynthesis
MENKFKVLLIHRIFASYRKPIYDKLATKYDFLLLYGQREKTIFQARTSYSKPIKSIQYSKNPTNLFLEGFTSFFKFKPQVVIHDFLVGVATILPMYVCTKLMGAKFILYSHGYNRLYGFNPKKNWSDKYRLFLMKIADATVIYTNTDKKRLGAYADVRKLFVAQNTLDTTELAPIKRSLVEIGKGNVKEKLGFSHKYNITFIGRLLEEKMPEKVLDVFTILQEKMPNEIGVHFVGDGKIEALKERIKGKKWQNDVVFHGPIYDDSISGAILFASDLMIMPGDLGLSVNHAFIFDCPIVSFQQNENGPFHGPEVEYVVNNETGFLVPDLSVEKMADTIAHYLQNESLQERMKEHIKRKMETLSPENMLKGFTDAIEFVLNGKY